MSLPNPSMSFSPFAILTAEEMNDIVENIESISDGSGFDTAAIDGSKLEDSAISTAKIADDAVTDAKLIYGKVRTRKGGSATDWQTPGANTYDYSGTNTFMQVGSVTLTAQTTALNFPTAFNQKPIVLISPLGSGGLFSAGWYVVSTSTTAFSIVAQDYAKMTPCLWLAIGE